MHSRIWHKPWTRRRNPDIGISGFEVAKMPDDLVTGWLAIKRYEVCRIIHPIRRVDELAYVMNVNARPAAILTMRMRLPIGVHGPDRGRQLAKILNIAVMLQIPRYMPDCVADMDHAAAPPTGGFGLPFAPK